MANGGQPSSSSRSVSGSTTSICSACMHPSPDPNRLGLDHMNMQHVHAPARLLRACIQPPSTACTRSPSTRMVPAVLYTDARPSHALAPVQVTCLLTLNLTVTLP